LEELPLADGILGRDDAEDGKESVEKTVKDNVIELQSSEDEEGEPQSVVAVVNGKTLRESARDYTETDASKPVSKQDTDGDEATNPFEKDSERARGQDSLASNAEQPDDDSEDDADKTWVVSAFAFF
jgi:hypothetical protein